MRCRSDHARSFPLRAATALTGALVLASAALAGASAASPPAASARGTTAVPAGASAFDLEAAERAFLAAAAKETGGEREAALKALVDLGDVDAIDALVAEYARTAALLRGARDEVYRLRYVLERRRALVASMELRAARDPSLVSVIVKQKEAVEGFEKELAAAREKLAANEPWRETLGRETRRLFAAVGEQKQRRAEKTVWKDVEEHPDRVVRTGAVEMLGEVGSSGTALALQARLIDVLQDRARIARDLPKLYAEVHKIEERLQRESEQLGGKTTKALNDQYERTRQEARTAQTASTQLAHFADALVEAAGRALAREEGETLDKSLQAFVRALKRARGPARLRTLEILAHAPTDGVKARLRELLALERDPAGKARLIADVAALDDRAAADLLLETYLEDESWHVRSATYAALARLRSKAAIPALIERLDVEQGRQRTDAREALVSLTGQEFHTNAELWRRWWADAGEGFAVPELPEEGAASDDAVEAAGMTFFGIRTESQRVLFVFDLSGSMNFSMVPRKNPADEDPNNPDMPREGEISRLTAAKRALVKALGGLSEGATFNLVFYASDVRTWKKGLVTMDPDTRAEVLAYVEGLEAVGGTNIFGAMETALDLAGAEEGGDWAEPEIDTIFLLTDGRASVGVTTDSEEILTFVTELNRSAGIVIHTIGLSGAQDAYLLRSLAEQNGGTYAAR